MEEVRRVYKVPAANLDWLRQKVDALNRRAIKLKAPPIDLKETGIVDEHEEKGDPFSGLSVRTGRILRSHLFEITGEAPKLSGWTFVATLDLVPDVGAVIRAVPGQEVPARYRNPEAGCDHCHAKRNRVNHYLVRNEAGEYRQVGSSCIKDFLGHQNPESVIWLASLLGLMGEVLGEAERGGGGGGQAQFLDRDAFLANVAACIRVDGWTSRKAAKENERAYATADQAMTNMFPGPTQRPKIKVEEEDRQMAATAVAWASEIDPGDDDYLHNLKVIASSELLPPRATGVAASIIAAYKRHVEKVEIARQRQREGANSKHVGEIGKRQTFLLTLVFETNIPSDYGVVTLYKFVDAESNIVVWFSSGYPSTAPMVGHSYEVKATVKRHDQRDGVNQTIITRGKIQKEIVKQEKENAQNQAG